MQIKRKKNRRISSRFWQLKLDANITNITVYSNEKVVLWNRQFINVSAKCADHKRTNCVMCVYGGTQVCDLIMSVYKIVALQVALEPVCQCRRRKRWGLDPWVGKIPWRIRAWQPTPVFLPGESHGQRSLGGYSPWGRKESDTTQAT